MKRMKNKKIETATKAVTAQSTATPYEKAIQHSSYDYEPAGNVSREKQMIELLTEIRNILAGNGAKGNN
jgi:hypothetical protein